MDAERNDTRNNDEDTDEPQSLRDYRRSAPRPVRMFTYRSAFDEIVTTEGTRKIKREDPESQSYQEYYRSGQRRPRIWKIAESSRAPPPKVARLVPRRNDGDVRLLARDGGECSTSAVDSPGAGQGSPSSHPRVVVRRSAPVESPLREVRWRDSGEEAPGGSDMGVYVPYKRGRILPPRRLPPARRVEPPTASDERYSLEDEEYETYDDEEREVDSEIDVDILQFLQSPEIDLAALGARLCEANVRNAVDVEELLRPIKGPLGSLRLQSLFTRARTVSDEDHASYSRLLELGIAVKFNAMQREIELLREEVAEVKRQMARCRRRGATADIVDDVRFVRGRVTSDFVLTPKGGLPGGALREALNEFVCRPSSSAESTIAAAKRCVRFLLHKLIPNELKSRYTIRSKKGRRSDDLMDFPTTYRIAVRDIVLECLGLGGIAVLTDRYNAERVSYVSDELDRTMQETLNDMRRKSGRDTDHGHGRLRSMDGRSRDSSPHSTRGSNVPQPSSSFLAQ